MTTTTTRDRRHAFFRISFAHVSWFLFCLFFSNFVYSLASLPINPLDVTFIILISSKCTHNTFRCCFTSLFAILFLLFQFSVFMKSTVLCCVCVRAVAAERKTETKKKVSVRTCVCACVCEYIVDGNASKLESERAAMAHTMNIHHRSFVNNYRIHKCF